MIERAERNVVWQLADRNDKTQDLSLMGRSLMV